MEKSAYTILSTFHESERTKVLLATRTSDQSKVIIKTVSGKGLDEYARIQNEYTVMNVLKDVMHDISLDTIGDLPCLVRPFIEGDTLRKRISEQGMGVKEFLETAIAIADFLQLIHQYDVIHKDINPDNIVCIPNEKKVAIIDFDIASQFDRKLQMPENPDHLEGTLRYISPEQTGRMNRQVDYRSDLYSLGISFYEMLMGHVPFISDDPMELVHAHIARNIPMDNSHLPAQLSAIILKLTAKNAEDRYQSAKGLKKDLERCLEQWLAKGSIDAFLPACNDRTDRLLIPEKLYGREKELKELNESFEEITKGEKKIFIISGYAGVGKTSLVLDLYKRLPEKNGVFISGKFDLFHKNTPYYGWALAISHFTEFLLTENQQKIGTWKQKLKDSLGAVGKVMTDLVPDLELIIGEQPPLPPLPSKESENRFAYAVRSFIAAVADREHPLIIFIDDFQWADLDSIRLLKNIALDPQCNHMMLIITYRENEVSKSHPLTVTLEEMQEELNAQKVSGMKTEESIVHISLSNLSKEDVKQLVKDTLPDDSADLDSLIELVFEKTQGNSFFVTQFLKALYDEKLLAFDDEKQKWSWDIEKIRRKNITDNVVELLAEKIRKLSPETQQVLTLASCIGSRFDLKTLSTIYSRDVVETGRALQEAIFDGYIIPEANNFKMVEQVNEEDDPIFLFVHDRIQQAVYSLIPSRDKATTHYRIGKLLLADTENADANLFDIVNHLDNAIEIVSDANERRSLASLNYDAGLKAKAATAFSQANTYFTFALKLLKADSWQEDYDFTLKVYNEVAESAYLSNKPEELERASNEVMAKARTPLDKVNVYESRILAYTAVNKMKEATAEALDILRQLGVRFPSKPGQLSVIASLLRVRMMLPSSKINRIVDFPLMTDPTQLAIAKMLVNSAAAFFLSEPALYPLIILKLVNISVKYGNCAESLVGYGSYGLIMAGIVGDIESGYRIGKQSMLLLEKFNRKDLTAIAQFTYSTFIHHWKEPLSEAVAHLQDGFEKGLQTGSIEYAAWCTLSKTWQMFYSGYPLKELIAVYHSTFELLQQYGQLTPLSYERIYYSMVRNLVDKTDHPEILKNEFYDEGVMEQVHLDGNDRASLGAIYLCKAFLAYTFDKNEVALVNAEKVKGYSETHLSTYLSAASHFYDSLIRIRAAESSPHLKRKYLKQAQSNLGKFKKWNRFSPENYGTKMLIIDAELKRIAGKNEEAAKLYESAIQLAQQTRLIQDEALALELTGRFYLSQNQNEKAEKYFIRSANGFRQWGAINKASQVEEKYLKAEQPVAASSLKSTVTEKTISSSSGLDALSLIKSSQALSGEIVLSKLLEKLLRLVIENAGAQKGSLLLNKNGELFIQAEATVGSDVVNVMQSQPLDESAEVCAAIIHYVARKKESLVLEDAENSGQFNNDPYIKSRKVKSVLCAPIQNQGKLTGITYLENNLTTNAFTKNRLDIVNLLSSQAAISIDNAKLYEDLEEYNQTLELKVGERTEEIRKQKDLIEKEKQKSDDLLLNILPLETAEELKATGVAQPRRYELVSVLFSDFVNFTRRSEQVTPDELVQEIHFYYSAFDEIISRFGLEKIKTIGDSYMCAGGLPVEDPDNAIMVVKAAIAIQKFMKQTKEARYAQGKIYFESRIGVHSGPVVAGIVGTKKFAYDIWGDTVNIASRMESSGETGQVNISGATYELIKNQFACTYRGKIDAKNKGQVDMYFVEQENSSMTDEMPAVSSVQE